MLRTIAAVTLVVASSACLSERAYVDPNKDLGGTTSSTQTPLALAHGALKGDFGGRTGFDGSATSLIGTTDSEWQSSTVTLARAEQLRGTGMVILWTNGVALDDLEVGTHVFDFDASSLDVPLMSMNVCSGTDASSIDYDRPADQVTATVVDEGGTRTINLHTATHTLDPITGDVTTTIESSDTSFDLPSRFVDRATPDMWVPIPPACR